jgi:hypothetical protein
MSELWLLVVIGLAFALIFGIAKPKTVFSVIGCMLILLLLKPFYGLVINALPWWMNAILMIVFGFSMVSWMTGLIFGARTRSELAGLLLHDIILIPFRLIGYFAGKR